MLRMTGGHEANGTRESPQGMVISWLFDAARIGWIRAMAACRTLTPSTWCFT